MQLIGDILRELGVDERSEQLKGGMGVEEAEGRRGN